jgi:hypothetical protein
VNSLNPWEHCGTAPATAPTGCYQKYTATINPPNIQGTIAFTLNSTGFQGDATNRCFKAADGSTDPTCMDPINFQPDYIFDPSIQSPGVFSAPSAPVQGTPFGWTQTIQTAQPGTSADVWVTSHDYGGYGNVVATATVDGYTITALVPQIQWPAAQIPIDANQDYIPDAQEQIYWGVPTIDPSADAEPNGNGAPAGDGFSAFEEYRGFVVVSAYSCAPGCTFRQRTNPISDQDVFIVDTTSSSGSGGLYENFGSILSSSTPFVYHSLSLDLGNPIIAGEW